MTKAPRKFWARSISTAALTSLAPRAVAAVALTAAFAFLAPDEGSLDTGHQQPELPDPGALQDPLGIANGLGGVKNLSPNDAVRLASNAEELSIPPVALAAYQRAATVLNDADASCRIDWALIAAIGMVESNHGRFGGSELDSNGLAVPAIIGPQLNGAGNYAAIRDTDNGLYDHDTVYDRAVGPMQFIPSTWTVAGTDGDGDNRRDPQDIDDAAVATAAYLCAGTEDVSTDAGARAAVYRYNQSDTYVKAVLQIAEQYRNGEFPGSPSVDGGSPSTLRPHVSALPRTSNTVTAKPKADTNGAAKTPVPTKPAEPAKPTDSGKGSGDNGPSPSSDPTTAPSQDPTTEPSTKPSDGTEPGDGQTSEPTDPTPTPTDAATAATLAEPCRAATVKVYGATFEEDDKVTYDAVIASCIATFEPETAMPEAAAIEEHVRGLYGSEDQTFADLPEPITETDAPDEAVAESPTASPAQ